MPESYGATAVFSVRDNMTGPIAKIHSALSGLNEGTSKVRAGLGNLAAGSAVFSIVQRGFQAITASVGQAVSRFDTLNNFPKVMESMGASTKASTQAINRLKNGVQGLPTSLDSVAKTTEALFPAMGNNVDKAAQSTLALNDAFLASNASAADASRGMQQYTQMLSTGKVDMMSWRTLEETMPASLEKVAKSFGITDGSMQTLYADVQSGKITMSELNDRFIELDGGVNGFHQTALNATAGIGTAVDNMKNRIAAGLANILQGVNNLVQRVTGLGIAGWINAISSAISSFLSDIGNRLSGLANSIKPYWDTLRSAVTSVVGPIRTAISSVIKSYEQLYAENDKTAAFNTFKTVVEDVANVLIRFAQIIQQNYDRIAGWIPIIGRVVAAWAGFRAVLPIASQVSGALSVMQGTAISAASRLQNFFGIGAQFVPFGQRALTAASNVQNLDPAVIGVRQAINETNSAMSKFGLHSLQASHASSGLRSALDQVGNTQAKNALNQVVDQLIKLGPAASESTSRLDQIRNRFTAIRSAFSNFGQLFRANLTAIQESTALTASSMTGFSGIVRGAIQGISAAFTTLSATLSANPIGAIIAAIAVAVIAFAAMWHSNFMNIQGVTKSVFSAIGQAIGSLGAILQPAISAISSAFQVLQPVLQSVGTLLGGVLVAALASVAVSLGVVADVVKVLAASFTVIVIQIRTFIEVVADAGRAIGEFFSGNFAAAAKDAKKSLSDVKKGVSDIGNTWKTTFSSSATVGAINGLKQMGQQTDSNKAKTQDFGKAYKSVASSIDEANKRNVSSVQEVGQAMESAFTDQSMQNYVKSSESIMTSFASRQRSIQSQTNKLMEAAEKAHGSRRLALQQQAIQTMLSDQSKGASQMQQLLSDNTKQLETGVSSAGQKLTDDQKQALQQQTNEVARQLEDQAQTELRAYQLKIANHEKWTQQDTQGMIAALKQQNTALNAQRQINAAKEKQLQGQIANAKTQTERNAASNELQELRRSDQQKLVEIEKNNAQQLEAMARSGQLTHATFVSQLSQMRITTTQGLQAVLSVVNAHSGTIQERLQTMARYFGSTGRQAASNLLTALASGNYKGISKQVTDDSLSQIKTLPASMFKHGSKGKTDFLNALRQGQYRQAGQYISASVDQGAKSKKSDAGSKMANDIASGLHSNSGKVRSAARDVANSAQSGLSAGNTGKARSSGTSLTTSYGAGISSGSKTASSNARSVARSASSGLKTGSSGARSAGSSLSSKYVSGVKSRRPEATEAGRELGTSTGSGINSRRGSVEESGAALGNAAVRGARSAHGGMTSAGAYLASGLAAGISSGSGAVRAAAEAAVSSAVAAAKAKAKIHSPSRVMRDEVGQWLAKGMAAGITDFTPEAEQSAENMVTSVRNAIAGQAGLQLDTSSQVEVTNGGGLLTMLTAISHQLAQGHNIVLDSGALVGATVQGYDQKLGSRVKNAGRYEL